MIKKFVASRIIQLFCILWAAFLFLDYFNYSNYFYDAYLYFEYADLLFVTLILTAGITYLLSSKKKIGFETEIKNFRGIYHYAFTLCIMALIMLFYSTKTNLIPNPLQGTLIFIFKSIGFHIGLGFILFAAHSSGTYILDLLPITIEKNSSILISLAIGFIVITTGLFFLGLFGLLHQFIVIPFILILIFPAWKKSFETIRQTLFKKSDPFKIHSLAILAYACLILLLAINLTATTRTFPTGYDGLNLYMNTPKLIAGYHGLTHGGDAYNWSLFMSLGFIIFNNTTITILLSVMPGILSIIGIYLICKNLNINRNWSLFACALFYSLPNTIWLSRIEEKVDLAMLFYSLVCVLLLSGKTTLQASLKKKDVPKKLSRFSPDTFLWILCGILLGYSFGIKYIAMLSIFALLVVLFYIYAGKYGAIAIFFLNFAIIFGLDLTRFAAFEKDLMFYRFIVPFILGFAALILAYKKNSAGVILSGKYAFVFGLTIGLTFLPWALEHISENKKLSIDSILTGKSPLPELYSNVTNNSSSIEHQSGRSKTMADYSNNSKMSIAGFETFALPKNPLQLIAQLNTANDSSNESPLKNIPQEKSTNKEKHEEIRRFLGYETGIIRFISLPYRIVMKSNVRLPTSDTGILLLILLPVFIFGFTIKQLPLNLCKMILLLLLLIFSIQSVQLIVDQIAHKTSFDTIKSSGSFFFGTILLPLYDFLKQTLITLGTFLMPIYNYLTIQPLGICFILMVLFSIPIYFLFKNSLTGLTTISKIFIAFTFSILQYWIVLSSGIIWYGIAGFSLIPIIIVLLTNKEESDSFKNPFIKRYVIVCSCIWFALILPYQFIPSKYLLATDMTKINFKEFLDVQFARYAVGEYDEKEVLKNYFNPAQFNIVNTLNRDKKSKILNVSTFLNYYIVNNDSRVYMDNQLGVFKGMYDLAKNDKTLLPLEFKKNNIKYILVGLNAPAIDMTPDKSLTKKFNQLMMALVNNPQVRLLHTNRLVERPDGDLDINVNGIIVKAKYDMVGKHVIDQGTDALFEIL
jgi:hypothetical protein